MVHGGSSGDSHWLLHGFVALLGSGCLLGSDLGKKLLSCGLKVETGLV